MLSETESLADKEVHLLLFGRESRRFADVLGESIIVSAAGELGPDFVDNGLDFSWSDVLCAKQPARAADSSAGYQTRRFEHAEISTVWN